MTATRHFISSYFSHYEKRASLSYNINTAVVSGYRTNNFNSVHEFIGQTQPTEYKLIYYTHFVDRNSTAVKWGKTKKWQTCTLNMNRSSVSIKSMPAEIQQQFFFLKVDIRHSQAFTANKTIEAAGILGLHGSEQRPSSHSVTDSKFADFTVITSDVRSLSHTPRVCNFNVIFSQLHRVAKNGRVKWMTNETVLVLVIVLKVKGLCILNVYI